MDILDQAAAVEELHRTAAMANRDRGPVIAAQGFCLCCDHPLPAGHRWCDAECRDVWQSQQPRRH